MGKRFGDRCLEAILQNMVRTQPGIKDAYVSQTGLCDRGWFGRPDRGLARQT
jgi:hypothetical protein